MNYSLIPIILRCRINVLSHFLFIFFLCSHPLGNPWFIRTHPLPIYYSCRLCACENIFVSSKYFENSEFENYFLWLCVTLTFKVASNTPNMFCNTLAHFKQININRLTGFFYTCWKHQKTSGFLMFSRRYRKRPVAWNGLTVIVPIKWFLQLLHPSTNTSSLASTNVRSLRILRNCRNTSGQLFLRVFNESS